MEVVGGEAECTFMDGDCGERKSHRRGLFARGTGRHAQFSRSELEGEENEDASGDEELAQIVHDLKNPLSTIALEIDLMDARLDGGDRFDTVRAIGRIRENVRYLDRLIYDLIDMCTLSNGHFALRRARCDLGRLLESVIDRVVPSSERHRVTLDAPDLTEAVIDELRIERVIANLIDNALKYTPSSGGIVVRLTREGVSAQISVCDAGPGLSPAELDIVFEPYRRCSSSRGRQGTGLGLYVSKQIVEAHGGRIGCESVRGAGARFYFALPI
jgi:signal transduction histidine kinase